MCLGVGPPPKTQIITSQESTPGVWSGAAPHGTLHDHRVLGGEHASSTEGGSYFAWRPSICQQSISGKFLVVFLWNTRVAVSNSGVGLRLR